MIENQNTRQAQNAVKSAAPLELIDLKSQPTWRADSVRIAGFALAYFLAHLISFFFPDSQKVLMAVWPAGGIGLAALLLSPRRLWPALIAALFVSGVCADVLDKRLLPASLGFMLANVLESLGSAWLITKVSGGKVSFTRVREVAALILAATAVNACSAFVGAGTAALTSGAPFWGFWKTWWISDGLGILLITPLIVSWFAARPFLPKARLSSWLEIAAFFSIWTFCALLATRQATKLPPFVFFGLIGWPALRFGQRSVSIALFLLAAFLFSATRSGAMPFIAFINQHDFLLYAQIYFAVISISGFLLAATSVESRTAAKSQRQSEARYRAVVEQAADGIFIADETGRYIDANPRALAMTGYSREELLRLSTKDLLLPQDVSAQPLRLEELSAGRDVISERKMRRKDGTVFYAEISAKKIPDGRLQGIVRDITERKRIEAALQESERKFREMADLLPAVVCEMDASGKLTFVNSFGFSKMGYSPEDFNRGLTALDVVAARDRPRAAANMKLVANGDDIGSQEYAAVTKNGEEFPVLITSSRILKDDKFAGFRSVLLDITQQKRAERSVRESEEKYRNLFNNAEVGMFRTKADGSEIIDFNNKYLEIFRQTRDEMKGKSTVGFWADPAQRAEMVRLLAANGSVFDFECSMLRKSGEVRQCLASIRLIKDQGILEGSIIDITDRKRAEEALRESEQRYKMMFEQAPLAINITRGTEIVYANPPYLKMFGFSDLKELNRLAPLELFAPEWRDRVRENIARRAQGKSVAGQYKVECFRKDGTRIPILICLAKAIFAEGPMTVAFVIDITDRKRAETALRESEFFFKESQRAASIGSYKTDFVSGFWESSEVLDDIFGIDRNYERSVDGWLDIVHPDDRERMGKYLNEEVLTKRQPFDMEYRIVRKSDGEIRWVNGLGKIACDAAGTVVSMIGTILDITERKRTEAALQNAQKLDSLGALAGGIAHDFNNLLGGIFGYVDLAHSELAPGKRTHYLSKALATIDRARGLTRQLLTFAKGGEPERKTEILGQFIRDTAQFALSGANVSCSFEIPPDLWPCSIDKNQIGQVIDNIVINAQQAMPLGGTLVVSAQNVRLGVGEHPSLGQGDYVRISLSDTGVGIPADILPRIFDPFFTTKTKGHGLGLATCFSIVKRHNGAIDVVSEPGKGTTFAVYLPASAPDALNETAPIAIGHSGCGTILVMDDEEVVRDTVAEMLAKMGYGVECTENGTDTLLLFSRREKSGAPFCAAIFDLTIPGGLGGKETAAELRRLGHTLPLFVSSGYADDPVMARPEDFGFTASIGKPFAKADLAAVLETHLAKK